MEQNHARRIRSLEDKVHDITVALLKQQKAVEDISHAIGVQHVKVRVLSRLLQEKLDISEDDFHALCVKELETLNEISLEEDKKDTPVKTEIFGMSAAQSQQ